MHLLAESDNVCRIQDSLDEFLTMNSSRSCIIFDFDECLIDKHLSSELTLRYLYRIDSNLVNFKDHSFSGLTNILQGYIGLKKDEIEYSCRELAKETRWRPHALSLLQKLVKDQNFAVLIISSGLDLAIEAKLSSKSLSISKLACKMEFNEIGVCIQPFLVITSELKGYITNKIVESGKYKSVFAVGHSEGDIPMLSAATGIALRGDVEVERVASHIVSGFKEIDELLSSH